MKISISVIIGFLFCSLINGSEIRNATIVNVHDGDTITIVDNDEIKKFGKGRFTIRLFYIDAPELSQPFGKESKEFLEKLVNDKPFTIEFVSIDKYGRILGIVYVDSLNVNEEMLKNGMAWFYQKSIKKFKNESATIQKIQDSAKNKKIGLWSDNDPEQPWEFRLRIKENRNNGN